MVTLCFIRCTVLTLLFCALCYHSIVYAEITSASVTPTSLNAGVVTNVTVAFTSEVAIEVDGSVVLEFSSEFQVASEPSVAITTPGSTTTLSVLSVSTTQLSVLVKTTKIVAGIAFEFVIYNVTNPAAQTTHEFVLSIYDPSKILLERNAAVSGVTIASTLLSNVEVAPDDLNAGVTGSTSVMFASDVELPIDSQIVVTFPRAFTVASTFLSSVINIDSDSTVTSSNFEVTITVKGSVVTAGSNISFKLDNITNPGAKTTGTFAVATKDNFSRVFQSLTAINPVMIVSTTLLNVSVEVENSIAGVSSEYTFEFTMNVDIPIGGSVDLLIPIDYSLSDSLTVIDLLTYNNWTQVINGQLITMNTLASYPAGQHRFQIRNLENPGTSITGSFDISTMDANGYLLESANCPGITIKSGMITDAVLTPHLAHPGIVSSVDISFTSSAGLSKSSLLILRLPLGDYDAAVPILDIMVKAPVNITAAAAWNSTYAAMLIILTSLPTIVHGTRVDLQVTALEMPQSIRSMSTAASIESWNAKGLILDTPSVLTLPAITAVQNLSCTWYTNIPNPGITSNVVVTFPTNGKIPEGGKIILQLPKFDFYANTTGNAPAVLFTSPSTVAATSSWDSVNAALEVIVNDSIPASQVNVQMIIKALDTPASIRVAPIIPAMLTTFDPFGVVIDGLNMLQMDAITAGSILGSRIWTAVNAVAGVTSNQMIEFFITGKIECGGTFEFLLPDAQWNMAATSVATFLEPDLGDVGSVSWNMSSRLMIVTLTGSVSIDSYTKVSLLIHDVLNPPKETGIYNAYVTTKAPDNGVIDGPSTLSVMTISRGILAGAKAWSCINTTSASMQSDQRISFSLSGGLPSGSIIVLTLPTGGWRIINSATVSVAFSLPVTGITVQSAAWSSTTCELRIVTAGDMSEGTPVELIVKNMINPYSSLVANYCTVTMMLPDFGVVAESKDIVVNAISSDLLPLEGTLISTISTPGVLSTQTVSFTSGGELKSGAMFCLTITDEWTLSASTTASLTLTPSAQSSSLILTHDTTKSAICMQTAVAIDQETALIIVLTDVLSPQSIRPERLATLEIQSHLGGIVNTGIFRINAISNGELKGSLTWQPLIQNPGPVAGLKTSATLSFNTTGRIAAGGSIIVELPFEWVISSMCEATFLHPPVFGKASCSQNNISIVISDNLAEASNILVLLTGVYNPSYVMAEGIASCRTIASDGGTIDESSSLTTGAIVAAVTGIKSTGDPFTAVVGQSKTFVFEGSALAQNDVVKFVDASSTSDANCGESTTGQSDVGGVGIQYLSADGDISVKFTQSSIDKHPFVICYKFGDNPFKLYSTLSIAVKEIKSVSSDVGLSNIAVANFVKAWTFNGNGISIGDQMRWVDLAIVQDAAFATTLPDCLDTSTLATLVPLSSALESGYTRVISNSPVISFAFSAESSGKTFCLCYKFESEPFMIYPSIQVQVKHLNTIKTTSVGSDEVVVVQSPKSFKFLGNGVALNDRLYFVELGSVASCRDSDTDRSLQLLYDIGEQKQSLAFVDENFVAMINFDVEAAGMIVTPCYQFGIEPYQLYHDIRLTVKMIQQYFGTIGSPHFAVADVPKALRFMGYGMSEGDLVRWTLNQNKDCATEPATLSELVTLKPINTIALDDDNTATFNFSSTQDDFNPVLCYKFGQESFKLYANLSIAIGTIRAKLSQTGAKEIAVAYSRKNFTLYGANLAAGDRVGWTTTIDSTSSCSNLSLLVPNSLNYDDDFLSYVTDTNTVGVAFTSLSSGKRLYLCYGFGQEPFKLYELYLDVKSITNMRAIASSQSAVVAGAYKTFLFDGYGVATGDFAKFSSTTDDECTTPGITLLNIKKEFDDISEMAIFLYEISGTTSTGTFQVSDDTESVGLGRVLCYRFGIEPFVLYENVSIDVKTIWRLRQTNSKNGGQDNIVVVNEPKQMTIDGVGIGVKDSLKFISREAKSSDADCVDYPAQGYTDGHQLQVAEDLTVTLIFEYGSNGSIWTLCYKFDDEPYRMYTTIVFTVKEITTLLDYTFQTIAGLGEVAIIGHRKDWKPVGSGIQEGDTIKIVPQSVTSSAECGRANSNVASGTTLMTVDSKLTFSQTLFEYPRSSTDVYHLCYQFQDEPFTFIRDFTLTTYGISSLDRNVVLQNAVTTTLITGFHTSDTNELGWTTSSTTCSSMLGRTQVLESRATLYFTETYSQLYLCYSFNHQPFDIFSSLTLAVVPSEIWMPQSVSIVADQSATIAVFGTFGFTQGIDQVAWVPSDVTECSIDTVATYAEVMQSAVTSITKSESDIPNAGEALFNVKYVAPRSGSKITVTDSFSTWKLCYRFGSTPAYVMYEKVLCTVLDVTKVLLVSQEITTSGAVMNFEFDGVGIQDLDAVKWVDASTAANDADCNLLSSVGGSKVTDVVNSRATFDFTETKNAMALCYRFLGHSFKLYATISIEKMTKSGASSVRTTTDETKYDEEAMAASSDAFNLNRDVATVSLKLDKDINEIPPGSSAEAAFKASFVATLAASLGIDVSRIHITGLVAGSVIVQFQLLASDNFADLSVNEVVQTLQSQLQDSSSPLLSSNVVTVKNPSTALQVTVTSVPALTTTSSVALQALAYQPNGLISFVKSIYSVTEKSSKLTIPVIRLQGTSSILLITVKVQTVGTTAIIDTDYAFSDSTTFNEHLKLIHLRFDIGDSLQTIEINLVDDDVKEAHFSTIFLSLQQPLTAGVSLGSIKETVVRIYDYEDAIPLAVSSFRLNVDQPEDQQTLLQAWQVVANGENLLRVDGNGIFAVDEIIGDAEYNEKCDFAAPTGMCAYACEWGDGLPSSSELVNTYNVLSLDGDDYVASMSTIHSFPSEAFTVSLWVKTSQTNINACLYSYAVSSSTTPTVPLALCNPSNLQLYINAVNNISGIVTSINISDNAWHFLAVTWSSEDGRVRIFDNGILAFDGGSYRRGKTLDSNGYFIIGQLVLSSASATCTVVAEARAQASSISATSFLTATEDVNCNVVAESGFKGWIQHVHIWSRVLARSELLGELAWPFRVVSNGLILRWSFDTPQLLLQGRVVNDLSMRGQADKNPGVLNCKTSSSLQSAPNALNHTANNCLLHGVLPRLDTSFPCGPVYSNIWHFTAPATFVNKLKLAYGGRLQYRLLASSFNGTPRPRRGQVSIFSTNTAGLQNQISIALGSFDLPSSSNWTYYSIVLREDFGWITEPDGKTLTLADFKESLDGATALWIRGDIWGYDSTGPGQEVVYLNDVALYGR
ncbi:putative concanavalin A-like lectin/glucanase domain superfamily, CalX-like domain superfamily [Plasmopara halstedii]